VALTAKQRKFAWLVATGVSKTASYAKAYNSHGNLNTQGKNGHVLSKQPAIAAAIAEYEAQLLPIADARTEKLNALRSLKSLARSPHVSDRTRLAATTKLYEICAERERTETHQLPEAQLDHLIGAILREFRRAEEEARSLVQEESHEGWPLVTTET
jgi:hypothetical protein